VNEPFEFLLAEQHEVFTSTQAARSGLTRSFVRAQLAAGRWRRIDDRVLVAHAGGLDHVATLWAAVLGCGRGALISHDSAAHVQGQLAVPPMRIHVTIPEGRRIAPRPGVTLHRTRNPIRAAVGRGIPQVSVEDTVLDRAEFASNPDQVVALLVTAISKRSTTPQRMAAALARRRRSRWRELLSDLVADSLGLESVLEWRYRRDVERPHGLPLGVRQAVLSVNGVVERRDVLYDPWRVVTELDGRLGHTGLGAFRDMRRDNAALTRGEVTLRYGWSDVAGHPCEVAAQVALMLARSGWNGSLRRCARCPPR
jgi:hypothetical protein